MAKANIAHSYHQTSCHHVLHSDIWTQKARDRMSTARERRPITFASMSSEAAMAMQQLTNSRSNDSQNVSGASTRPKQNSKRRGSKSQESEPTRVREHVCTVKLSDIYEKLGAEQKLDGDITDPNTWESEEKQTKFVLGGGKMENAMEIVEIVNADDPKPIPTSATEDTDEHVIAEIARINSINKCNVWFEAHEALLESKAENESDKNTGSNTALSNDPLKTIKPK